MVSMTLLIAIQVLGMVYQARQHAASNAAALAPTFDQLDDDAIIEL